MIVLSWKKAHHLVTKIEIVYVTARVILKSHNCVQIFYSQRVHADFTALFPSFRPANLRHSAILFCFFATYSARWESPAKGYIKIYLSENMNQKCTIDVICEPQIEYSHVFSAVLLSWENVCKLWNEQYSVRKMRDGKVSYQVRSEQE